MRPLFVAVASVTSLVGQTAPDAVTIRYGDSTSTLNPVAQRITFVKSDSEDPKAAIANTLITQVGFNLLTMGVGSQMLRWNPYMGEAFSQFTNIGKGLFTGHGTDVKGFEYDSLPGLAAPLTIKPQPLDILMPLEPFRPTADFSADHVQPVLLRLQVRLDDEVRLMAAHQVVIKQEKKGRFDLKPKSERQESNIEERAIATQIERQPGNILHITTSTPLDPGEYALVLRTKNDKGAATQNVALKAAAAPPAQPATPPPPQRRGLFGVAKVNNTPQMPPAPPPGEPAVGFVAWDFRVVQ
jgi:hypothetical protein